jgi:heat shock protein HtpX
MWEQIRSNRVRTVILVAFMGLVLLLLGYAIGVAVIGSSTAGIVVALFVWGIMNMVAYFQGDSILLGVAGAKKIEQQDHPRLFNVVEEMKIASGLEKMPDIYIIDDPALNAFATGRDANHASVAITAGLLQKLNRDELQGVIGHEMAHIKNRDVLLMAMAAVLLGTIVILSYYASRFMFFGGMGGGRRGSSRDRDGGGGAQIIILVLAIVLMILAPILAQLIYFAISRRREYLADASSALYTRYPEGLASALEKLANSDTSVKAANQATAPMYTINPFKKAGMSANSLTSTHPPIAERVRILRSMSGASYGDYENAYKELKGKGIIPASAVTAGAVGLRAAEPVAPVEGPAEQVDRARDTSDMLWRVNDYRTIDCECGTRLRVSRDYAEPSVRCPHCGRIHRL